MAEKRPDIDPVEPGSVPPQPDTAATKKYNLKVIGGIAAVVLVIGVSNLHSGTKQVAVANSAMMQPTSPSATQVDSFTKQQHVIQQRDAEEMERQALLRAQNAKLQQEESVPGPESPYAAPMTPAQRDAMYGANNPNAPQRTSGQSQAQAEAKQRQIDRERQHQDALNSDTVAIDFAKPSSASGTANTGYRCSGLRRRSYTQSRRRGHSPGTCRYHGLSSIRPSSF